MFEDRQLSRRTVLKVAGAASTAALVAGCSGSDENGDGENGGDENGDENGDDENGSDGSGGGSNGDNGDETENGNETENGGDGNGNKNGDENGGDDNGDENGGDGNGDENGGDGTIDPGTRIEFDGQSGGWVGLAPDSIEGETNPTLALQEGETYEIGWTTGDGASHNIEIRDENDEVVDDLATEIVSDPGDDQWLEFEASAEMVSYVCLYHPTTMIGDIDVR